MPRFSSILKAGLKSFVLGTVLFVAACSTTPQVSQSGTDAKQPSLRAAIDISRGI